MPKREKKETPEPEAPKPAAPFGTVISNNVIQVGPSEALPLTPEATIALAQMVTRLADAAISVASAARGASVTLENPTGIHLQGVHP